MGPRKRLLAARRLLLLLACTCACAGGGFRGPRGPRAAMAFPAPDGGVVDLARFQGRLVVVHFFAMNSIAAQADVPELQRAAAASDVVVVGINLDQDSASLVRPWADAAGVTWPIALATRELLTGETEFGAIHVVPTTVLLDRDGFIAWRSPGQLAEGALGHALDDLR